MWTESYIIVVISKHIEENKGFLHNYTKLHLVHIAAFSVFRESNKTVLVLFNTLWLNKTSVVPSFRVHTVHRAPLLWRSQRQNSVTQYKPRNTSSQKRHDCWLVALDCEQSKQKKKIARTIHKNVWWGLDQSKSGMGKKVPNTRWLQFKEFIVNHVTFRAPSSSSDVRNCRERRHI